MTLHFALNTVFHQVQLVFQQLSTQTSDFIDATLSHAMPAGRHAMPTACSAKSTASALAIKAKSRRSTGYSALDAALSDCGWPEAGAVEVVADNFGFAELALFLPLLKQITQHKQQVAWISPPQMPHLASLQDNGIATENLKVVMAYGHTSYWAAEQAVRAGNARVLLYWPEVTVTASQRNKLNLQAKASGTLLFVLLSSDDAVVTNATIRLQLSNAPVNILQPAGAPCNAALSTANLLANTSAIIFEQQPRESAVSKRNKRSAIPMLTGIGYSNGFSNVYSGGPETSAHAGPNNSDSITSSSEAARADLWVTLLSNRNVNAAALTIPISAAASISTQEFKAKVNATPSFAATTIASEIAAPNKLENTLIIVQRRPILGRLQISTQSLELAQTRVDVLRLNRLIEITMPTQNAATPPLSTPSSRARRLALNNIRGTTAPPLIGQPLLRQQAKHASRVRNAWQIDNAALWAQTSAQKTMLRAAVAQSQLA